MSGVIETFQPKTGRHLTENSELYNLADFYQNQPISVARGQKTGSNGFYAYGQKFTDSPIVDEVVWPNGTWSVPPQTGIQISVVSTSANDTAGGTGINSVRIIYLDSNYNEQREDVILNGLTPVLTVATDIVFLQCEFMLTYGSGKKAAGDISFSNAGNNYGFIQTGAIRCSSSARMVPAGKRLLVNQLIGSATSGTSATPANIKIASTVFDGIDYTADGILFPLGNLGFQDNSFGIPLTSPIPFTERSIVAMVATCAKASVTISASWYGILEDKPA